MGQELHTVKAAAVQAEPIVLDCEATVEKTCQLISEAAANGAQLIAFPEMFIPTYVNSSIWRKGLAAFDAPRAKAAWLRLWRNSVEIASQITDQLCKAAHDSEVVVVLGVNERDVISKSLYNTLLFINSDPFLDSTKDDIRKRSTDTLQSPRE